MRFASVCYVRSAFYARTDQGLDFEKFWFRTESAAGYHELHQIRLGPMRAVVILRGVRGLSAFIWVGVYVIACIRGGMLVNIYIYNI